ncbi:MAG: response regulator transcription factor [Cyclobacteriaceae bacterium]|nr:response regulator transcription factor [Cyclobacteriaceae bacterium]
MKHKILLAEDDPALAFVTKDNLEAAGFIVIHARDGKEAFEKYRQEAFDIIILDIMMPRMDGYTLAEKIRTSDSQTPILFLSAKSMLEDRLEGLKLGGDDYLTKPFNMEELILRIGVFLKRANPVKQQKDVYMVGRYTFYYEKLLLQCGDYEKKLTSREAAIFLMFCKNIGEVLKREDILKEIWGKDDYFLGRSMDVFISRLRKYLKHDPTIEIVNYHGVGFCLTISPT